MKRIYVKREKAEELVTGGKLYLSDEMEVKQIGYTLEPTKKKIPAGKYTVVSSFSPKFKGLRPRVRNVPGREGILMHEGNTVGDTSGCILVGLEREIGEMVIKGKRESTYQLRSSRAALGEILEWIGNGTACAELEITEE